MVAELRVHKYERTQVHQSFRKSKERRQPQSAFAKAGGRMQMAKQ